MSSKNVIQSPRSQKTIYVIQSVIQCHLKHHPMLSAVLGPEKSQIQVLSTRKGLTFNNFIQWCLQYQILKKSQIQICTRKVPTFKSQVQKMCQILVLVSETKTQVQSLLKYARFRLPFYTYDLNLTTFSLPMQDPNIGLFLVLRPKFWTFQAMLGEVFCASEYHPGVNSQQMNNYYFSLW